MIELKNTFTEIKPLMDLKVDWTHLKKESLGKRMYQ